MDTSASVGRDSRALWGAVAGIAVQHGTVACHRQPARAACPRRRAHRRLGWVRPAPQTWDELWQRVPRFRGIWLVCTVIWGTAILADAVIRVVMAATLPLGIVPGLNGALWPVTFVVLQVVTNVYFYQSGFWRILREGAPEPVPEPRCQPLA